MRTGTANGNGLVNDRSAFVSTRAAFVTDALLAKRLSSYCAAAITLRSEVDR